MQAVLIAMTILGCDDSISQCNYVATVDKRWETVSACDAEAERRLKTYVNVNYPSVIAVCEAPKAIAAAEPPKPAPAPAAAPEVAVAAPQPAGRIAGFAEGIAGQVRAHLPSGRSVKDTLTKPVHFVSASYSWVVTRLAD
ncbi:hypothetical protein [Rhizobium leguminosarum]|jgi:hypothetical protein|uniref:Uncharacterized protein n=1 Tax=Rhizobium leguminosarum bv. trifolii (strain WSM1325) TaxID=395491 RepID=C6AYL5_RHILS|nr:hypothetical protein [Rhizobium leguminosarum]ACS56317.1 conserved hypothetical protein [Rhizobium leguminosarum bv. trifolii WSM1325]MBY2909768.1 hypothetical protein [Rhizobium leguminosarum]MBY2917334.1 hypothetical protein [Rhizobium leguminosarum]MBY2920323.1 hypothetical protein [Rhizobium leguminosarum]MBY2934601.1 hypothetical protein [Rhizobium leguminosarum]